jgi:hypothetical protein
MDRSNAVFTRVEEGIIMKSDIDNTEVGKRLQNLRTLRLGKSSFLLKILRS